MPQPIEPLTPSEYFGPLISTWDVEQAVLVTLGNWLPIYLAVLEEINNLPKRTIPRPPVAESLHGGVDYTSYILEQLPSVIVVVEPIGNPGYAESVGYTQAFAVGVGCVYQGFGGEVAEQPEDEARMVASYYGAAAMLLVQQGALSGSMGDLVERVRLTGAPRLTTPDPSKKQVCLSVTTFNVWIAPIVREVDGALGPLPEESPEYPGEPEEPFGKRPVVKKEKITIKAEPI